MFDVIFLIFGCCVQCDDPVSSKSFVLLLLVDSDADDDSFIMDDPAASVDAVMVDAIDSIGLSLAMAVQDGGVSPFASVISNDDVGMLE